MKRTPIHAGQTVEILAATPIGTRELTIFVNGEDRETSRDDRVADALRDNLSPGAVAVIAAHLHGMVNTRDAAVNHQVAWFTDLLLGMVGDNYNDLCEGVGL